MQYNQWPLDASETQIHSFCFWIYLIVHVCLCAEGRENIIAVFHHYHPSHHNHHTHLLNTIITKEALENEKDERLLSHDPYAFV